jgi:hypothetical protein
MTGRLTGFVASPARCTHPSRLLRRTLRIRNQSVYLCACGATIVKSRRQS